MVGQTAETASAIDGFSLAAELESSVAGAANGVKLCQTCGALAEKTKLCTRPISRWQRAMRHGPRSRRKANVNTVAVCYSKWPHKLDMHHLVPVEEVATDGLVQLELSSDHWRQREGFQLTDPGTDLTGALDQTNYCIKCHNQAKDSCSTGLKEKNGSFKSSVFGVPLAGCPLDEKISEMNVVKGQGNPIGALGNRDGR